MSAGIALGTAQWGMPYGIANCSGPPRPEAAAEMLRHARGAGVCALDTARDYGASEALIGQLLERERESDWRVITKLAADVAAPGLSREQALARVSRSLSQSRHALCRERLDVLLLHRARHRYAFGGALWTQLRHERAEGRIGVLGVSTTSPAEAIALLGDPEIEVLQVASSLLDQRLVRAGFFERARSSGVAIHVRSIFLQGVAHLPPRALPRPLEACAAPLAAIWRFAARCGATPRAVFLAYARWLTQDLADRCAVIGCETPNQLAEILADWRRGAVEPEAAAALARELPVLPDKVVDPSLWPGRPDNRAVNPGQPLAPR